MRHHIPFAILAASASCVAAGTPPVALSASTQASYDELTRCFHDRWTGSGKLTTINNAAGTILDFAFDTVGADGRIAQGHASFAIEDRGTERRVTATAANPADAPLTGQMLTQTMSACAPTVARR